MSASRAGPPKAPRVKRPLSEDRKVEVEAAPYDTGFGKPSKDTQFKKGVSGNPTGRPKASRALRTDVLVVLDVQVQVQLPQGAQIVSMQHAMVLSMAAKAARGDTRAAMVMIRLMELTTPERLREAPEATKLDADEQALFDSLLADLGLPNAAGPGTPEPPAADNSPSDPEADGKAAAEAEAARWDIL